MESNLKPQTCTKCRETKTSADFYKKAAMCKPCHKIRDSVRKNRGIGPNDTPAARLRKRRWTDANKEAQAPKNRTRILTLRAIKSGALVRPEACEVCNKAVTRKDGVTAIQAHHDDYTKPLSVRWLCPKCHKAWHRVNTAIE
jgi:Zn finger protein HypA/HybF involved in hydrogenase expression